jgi:hypothetical protein
MHGKKKNQGAALNFEKTEYMLGGQQALRLAVVIRIQRTAGG